MVLETSGDVRQRSSAVPGAAFMLAGSGAEEAAGSEEEAMR
jgi:hypothetical protein